jgi:hypothetical protein
MPLGTPAEVDPAPLDQVSELIAVEKVEDLARARHRDLGRYDRRAGEWALPTTGGHIFMSGGIAHVVGATTSSGVSPS